MKLGSLLGCLLFASAFCSMKLMLTADEEALCLDGSKGSFYYEAGSGSGSKKWIIYFQGGGWIGGNSLNQTLNSAFQRSETYLGSSNGLNAEATLSGIFDRNSVSNPELYNWNYIFVNYCDGTGHQGHSTQPYVVNGKNIYFRGEKIVKSILQQFNDKLQTADQILVSGCSAGGLAAFTWTQYISDQFKNVQVLSAPDSGIFQDFPTFDGTNDYKTFYQLSFMQLSNVEVDPPNKQCITENQYQKWKCLFAQYLIGYITVPMYIIQSPYDSWCIPNILKIKCANDETLTRCTDKERSFIEAHSSNIQIILNGRFSHYNNTGAFAPACLKHCFLTEVYNSGAYQVPGGSGNTIQKSFAAWIVNQVGDYNYIDKVQWPINQQCSKFVLER